MFRFSAFCHERYLGQVGYPTLTRLHGKLSPRLKGLPYLADRATHLSGSTHLSCKRDQNEIRNYRDRRVTSPSWGPPPPCKQALSSQKKGRVNKILMENNLTGNQVLEDAENQIREACEVLQREGTRLRHEQKAVETIRRRSFLYRPRWETLYTQLSPHWEILKLKLCQREQQFSTNVRRKLSFTRSKGF